MQVRTADMPAKPIRVLLDSNILIAHEAPTEDADAHAVVAEALIHLLHELELGILVSGGTVADFASARPDLRADRARTLAKYYKVLKPVEPPANLRAVFPPGSLSPNDTADLQVLATFATGVAEWLITQDSKLASRAKRAGLRGVFSAEEALGWLASWRPPQLPNAAIARMVQPYTINLDAPIFDSLRADYKGFNTWWKSKVVSDNRHTILIGSEHSPDGIAVLKLESDDPFGLGSQALKICTFKIEECSQQFRLGELLLRAVIDYAVEQRLVVTYLTTHPSKSPLTDWLDHFGFSELARTRDGELVLAKYLRPPDGAQELPPLEHAIRYGPRNLQVVRAHIVPIQSRYHRRIFPDSHAQASLLSNEPCGNAIRKAYVCHASTRLLHPGDALLFLRTGDGPSLVDTVGVVEATLASRDSAEIVSFVRNRTVYSIQEIHELCRKGEILAVRFRLDRALPSAWTAQELCASGAMRRSPQSIAMVPEKGVSWVRKQLGV